MSVAAGPFSRTGRLLSMEMLTRRCSLRAMMMTRTMTRTAVANRAEGEANVSTSVTKMKGYSELMLTAAMPAQHRRMVSVAAAHERVLVTGAEGQIGVELVPLLRSVYGAANVLATDLQPSTVSTHVLDVTDVESLHRLVSEHETTLVVHLASLLSAVGELKPQLALRVNNKGLENVLEVARQRATITSRPLKVFSPSSIAAFGASTPKDETPNLTVMRPTTMYGVTKVFGELLGAYYASKYGIDYRSLRYPGIISAEAPPGGGTTDYAVDIYHQALTTGRYACFLREHTYLPMMYMDDCLRATMLLLRADKSRLEHTTYNVGAMTVCPSELVSAIQSRVPDFHVHYEPDFREDIAQSWPRSIDDSAARKDWDWHPEYDIERMTDAMLAKLRKKYAVDTASQHYTVAAVAGASQH